MKLKIKSTNDVINFNITQFLFSLLNIQSDFIYESSTYGFKFDSMREYWIELGTRNALVTYIDQNKNKQIKGYSFKELLQKVATLEFGTTPGVVLFDIRLETLAKLKERFGGFELKTLEEDVVFIPTYTRNKARRLVERIPGSFCCAYAIDRGLIFFTNENDRLSGDFS